MSPTLQHHSGSKAFAAGGSTAIQNIGIFRDLGTQNTELRGGILHIEPALLEGGEVFHVAGAGQHQSIFHPIMRPSCNTF